jgi:DNA-directed RNA polymerase subunit E'/Rpb7
VGVGGRARKTSEMVFFRTTITRTVIVEPHHLDAKLKDHVQLQNRREVSGKFLDGVGTVILTLRIPDDAITRGQIESLTGRVHFVVTFDAICFKLLKNEVVDGVVTQVTHGSMILSVGPVVVVVDRHYMPADYEFMPSADGDNFASRETGAAIKVGSAVRVRVVGAIASKAQIAAVCMMSDPGLGLL